jgi:hypothetical protein
MPATLVRKGLVSLMLLALVASAGCIEFERVITLNKDLSGTAKFRMTMNMEPMARIAAAMEHSMSGKPGDPTEDEVQAAIKKMTDEAAAKNTQADQKPTVGELPEGFKLLDLTQKMDGLKMTISATIGFTDVRKLGKQVPRKDVRQAEDVKTRAVASTASRGLQSLSDSGAGFNPSVVEPAVIRPVFV